MGIMDLKRMASTFHQEGTGRWLTGKRFEEILHDVHDQDQQKEFLRALIDEYRDDGDVKLRRLAEIGSGERLLEAIINEEYSFSSDQKRVWNIFWEGTRTVRVSGRGESFTAGMVDKIEAIPRMFRDEGFGWGTVKFVGGMALMAAVGGAVLAIGGVPAVLTIAFGAQALGVGGILFGGWMAAHGAYTVAASIGDDAVDKYGVHTNYFNAGGGTTDLLMGSVMVVGGFAALKMTGVGTRVPYRYVWDPRKVGGTVRSKAKLAGAGAVKGALIGTPTGVVGTILLPYFFVKGGLGLIGRIFRGKVPATVPAATTPVRIELDLGPPPAVARPAEIEFDLGSPPAVARPAEITFDLGSPPAVASAPPPEFPRSFPLAVEPPPPSPLRLRSGQAQPSPPGGEGVVAAAVRSRQPTPTGFETPDATYFPGPSRPSDYRQPFNLEPGFVDPILVPMNEPVTVPGRIGTGTVPELRGQSPRPIQRTPTGFAAHADATASPSPLRLRSGQAQPSPRVGEGGIAEPSYTIGRTGLRVRELTTEGYAEARYGVESDAIGRGVHVTPDSVVPLKPTDMVTEGYVWRAEGGKVKCAVRMRLDGVAGEGVSEKGWVDVPNDFKIPPEAIPFRPHPEQVLPGELPAGLGENGLFIGKAKWDGVEVEATFANGDSGGAPSILLRTAGGEIRPVPITESPPSIPPDSNPIYVPGARRYTSVPPAEIAGRISPDEFRAAAPDATLLEPIKVIYDGRPVWVSTVMGDDGETALVALAGHRRDGIYLRPLGSSRARGMPVLDADSYPAVVEGYGPSEMASAPVLRPGGDLPGTVPELRGESPIGPPQIEAPEDRIGFLPREREFRPRRGVRIPQPYTIRTAEGGEAVVGPPRVDINAEMQPFPPAEDLATGAVSPSPLRLRSGQAQPSSQIGEGRVVVNEPVVVPGPRPISGIRHVAAEADVLEVLGEGHEVVGRVKVMYGYDKSGWKSGWAAKISDGKGEYALSRSNQGDTNLTPLREEGSPHFLGEGDEPVLVLDSSPSPAIEVVAEVSSTALSKGAKPLGPVAVEYGGGRLGLASVFESGGTRYVVVRRGGEDYVTPLESLGFNDVGVPRLPAEGDLPVLVDYSLAGRSTMPVRAVDIAPREGMRFTGRRMVEYGDGEISWATTAADRDGREYLLISAKSAEEGDGYIYYPLDKLSEGQNGVPVLREIQDKPLLVVDEPAGLGMEPEIVSEMSSLGLRKGERVVGQMVVGFGGDETSIGWATVVTDGRDQYLMCRVGAGNGKMVTRVSVRDAGQISSGGVQVLPRDLEPVIVYEATPGELRAAAESGASRAAAEAVRDSRTLQGLGPDDRVAGNYAWREEGGKVYCAEAADDESVIAGPWVETEAVIPEEAVPYRAILRASAEAAASEARTADAPVAALESGDRVSDGYAWREGPNGATQCAEVSDLGDGWMVRGPWRDVAAGIPDESIPHGTLSRAAELPEQILLSHIPDAMGIGPENLFSGEAVVGGRTVTVSFVRDGNGGRHIILRTEGGLTTEPAPPGGGPMIITPELGGRPVYVTGTNGTPVPVSDTLGFVAAGELGDIPVLEPVRVLHNGEAGWASAIGADGKIWVVLQDNATGKVVVLPIKDFRTLRGMPVVEEGFTPKVVDGHAENLEVGLPEPVWEVPHGARALTHPERYRDVQSVTVADTSGRTFNTAALKREDGIHIFVRDGQGRIVEMPVRELPRNGETYPTVGEGYGSVNPDEINAPGVYSPGRRESASPDMDPFILERIDAGREIPREVSRLRDPERVNVWYRGRVYVATRAIGSEGRRFIVVRRGDVITVRPERSLARARGDLLIMKPGESPVLVDESLLPKTPVAPTSLPLPLGERVGPALSGVEGVRGRQSPSAASEPVSVPEPPLAEYDVDLSGIESPSMARPAPRPVQPPKPLNPHTANLADLPPECLADGVRVTTVDASYNGRPTSVTMVETGEGQFLVVRRPHGGGNALTRANRLGRQDGRIVLDAGDEPVVVSEQVAEATISEIRGSAKCARLKGLHTEEVLYNGRRVTASVGSDGGEEYVIARSDGKLIRKLARRGNDGLPVVRGDDKPVWVRSEVPDGSRMLLSPERYADVQAVTVTDTSGRTFNTAAARPRRDDLCIYVRDGQGRMMELPVRGLSRDEQSRLVVGKNYGRVSPDELRAPRPSAPEQGVEIPPRRSVVFERIGAGRRLPREVSRLRDPGRVNVWYNGNVYVATRAIGSEGRRFIVVRRGDVITVRPERSLARARGDLLVMKQGESPVLVDESLLPKTPVAASPRPISEPEPEFEIDLSDIEPPAATRSPITPIDEAPDHAIRAGGDDLFYVEPPPEPFSDTAAWVRGVRGEGTPGVPEIGPYPARVRVAVDRTTSETPPDEVAAWVRGVRERRPLDRPAPYNTSAPAIVDIQPARPSPARPSPARHIEDLTDDSVYGVTLGGMDREPVPLPRSPVSRPVSIPSEPPAPFTPYVSTVAELPAECQGGGVVFRVVGALYKGRPTTVTMVKRGGEQYIVVRRTHQSPSGDGNVLTRVDRLVKKDGRFMLDDGDRPVVVKVETAGAASEPVPAPTPEPGTIPTGRGQSPVMVRAARHEVPKSCRNLRGLREVDVLYGGRRVRATLGVDGKSGREFVIVRRDKEFARVPLDGLSRGEGGAPVLKPGDKPVVVDPEVKVPYKVGEEPKPKEEGVEVPYEVVRLPVPPEGRVLARFNWRDAADLEPRLEEADFEIIWVLRGRERSLTSLVTVDGEKYVVLSSPDGEALILRPLSEFRTEGTGTSGLSKFRAVHEDNSRPALITTQ